MPTRLWQSRFRPQPIRTYLLLFALALTIPVLTLAVFAINRMAHSELAEIERRVSQVAQEIAADIDRELDRSYATLETLAASDAVKRRDFAALHAHAVLALKPTKAAIVLLDRSHQQIIDTLKDFGVELPLTGDRETAQRVIDTKKRQISNLFKGSISGRPVFNVELPIFDNQNEVQFILVMSFQAAYIADLLRSVGPGNPWITGVTDNNGIILARSERHDDFVGKPLPSELLEQSRSATGVFRAINVAGDPILRATVRSDLAGWLVSATVPVSHLEAPITRSQIFSMMLLATAVGLGLLLAYVFGSFMTQPLAAATRLAASVGQGPPRQVERSPLLEANVLTQTLHEAALELERRQEHSQFLMRELAHRAKNQLAIIKGMVLQTARECVTIDDFSSQLTQRIQGLARSQDVLVAQRWEGAWLKDLVRAHLEVFGSKNRADIEGPDVFLDSGAAQNIGFALHELATNASKYGALSNLTGRVTVNWTLAEGSVVFIWRESGGPPVSTPAQKGFGHRIIMELVPQGIQGRASIDPKVEGLEWRLEFPAPHVTNGSMS